MTWLFRLLDVWAVMDLYWPTSTPGLTPPTDPVSSSYFLKLYFLLQAGSDVGPSRCRTRLSSNRLVTPTCFLRSVFTTSGCWKSKWSNRKKVLVSCSYCSPEWRSWVRTWACGFQTWSWPPCAGCATWRSSVRTCCQRGCRMSGGWQRSCTGDGGARWVGGTLRGQCWHWCSPLKRWEGSANVGRRRSGPRRWSGFSQPSRGTWRASEAAKWWCHFLPRGKVSSYFLLKARTMISGLRENISISPAVFLITFQLTALSFCSLIMQCFLFAFFGVWCLPELISPYCCTCLGQKQKRLCCWAR